MTTLLKIGLRSKRNMQLKKGFKASQLTSHLLAQLMEEDKKSDNKHKPH